MEISNLPHITAIVPAFNEELSIGSVVIGANKFVDQIIVVDDGSTDYTAEIAKKAKVNKLILTHISTRYKKSDQLKKESTKIFKNSVIAEDFMIHEVKRLGD